MLSNGPSSMITKASPNHYHNDTNDELVISNGLTTVLTTLEHIRSFIRLHHFTNSFPIRLLCVVVMRPFYDHATIHHSTLIDACIKCDKIMILIVETFPLLNSSSLERKDPQTRQTLNGDCDNMQCAT